MKPYNPFKMGLKKDKKDESFEVYYENDKYLSVPKFYGLNKLGNPTKMNN